MKVVTSGTNQEERVSTRHETIRQLLLTEAPNILCSVSRNHTFDFVICNAVKFFIPSLDKDDFVKRVAKGLRVMFDATIHYPLLSHAMSMHFTRSHGISQKLTLTHCSSHQQLTEALAIFNQSLSLYIQGHPMDLFLKISSLHANFCWLGDVEK